MICLHSDDRAGRQFRPAKPLAPIQSQWWDWSFVKIRWRVRSPRSALYTEQRLAKAFAARVPGLRCAPPGSLKRGRVVQCGRLENDRAAKAAPSVRIGSFQQSSLRGRIAAECADLESRWVKASRVRIPPSQPESESHRTLTERWFGSFPRTARQRDFRARESTRKPLVHGFSETWAGCDMESMRTGDATCFENK